jgi:hypothetical protein
MANDQSIRDAQDKQLIQKLKQIQTIEKIASDEKAPEASSAARELIERLKQPRQQQPVDLRPLFALASPNVGQRLLQATKAPSVLSQQEERLAKAAEIELKQQKLQAILSGQKQKAQNIKELEKYGRIMKGYERGATRMGKIWKANAQIERLSDYIDLIDSGQITFDDVSNADFSAAFSGLVTGKSPGIELIRETKYAYLGGKLKGYYQFMTGKPQKALSPEMYQEVKNMLGGLREATQTELSNEQAHLWNVYKTRLEQNPKLYETYRRMVDKYVDFDEEGYALPRGRAYDLNPSEGKKLQKEGETDAKQSLSKLERFRKALGR